jgi:hypothetical protein
VHKDDHGSSSDPELDQEFSLTWARSTPIHELSAHGRSVQQRLDTPAARRARPSFLKRTRFAIYRIVKGH